MAIENLGIYDDFGPLPVKDISPACTELSLSWTMDAVSQMQVSLIDPGLELFMGNLFQVRRRIKYGESEFEIASVEVDQGPGESANITLECRRRAIQRMKQDKTPEAYGGVTATDYAQIVADRFGLDFVGEPTSTKRTITKSSGPNTDESVWDILRKLAGEAQFSVFESDNTLYFASQEWLLGRWANLPFVWPYNPTRLGAEPFQILSIPNCRRSDDDEMEAEVRFVVNRSVTTMALRPGMTVNLSGMGEFDQSYLIVEVAYPAEQPEPVGIACRTPVKKKPKK